MILKRFTALLYNDKLMKICLYALLFLQGEPKLVKTDMEPTP